MFSIRNFLREREALLVHFSSPMRTCRSTKFPDDLKTAMRLKKGIVCFSLFCVTMSDFLQVQGSTEKENAAGNVGLVVDIKNTGSVIAVDSSDCGSILNSDTSKRQYLNNKPTKSTCAASIDERQGYNEWLVQNFDVVGIFVFEPICVWKEIRIGNAVDYAEVPISLSEVLKAFPDLKIISTCNGSFRLYDRLQEEWLVTNYDDILLDH